MGMSPSLYIFTPTRLATCTTLDHIVNAFRLKKRGQSTMFPYPLGYGVSLTLEITEPGAELLWVLASPRSLPGQAASVAAPLIAPKSF